MDTGTKDVDVGAEDVSVILFKNLQKYNVILYCLLDVITMLKGFVMEIFEIKFVHVDLACVVQLLVCSGLIVSEEG